eukprot:CAMPEP_0177761228 /NCGR_PEP_ID=MMETSP0491_2-20121128/5692_1 /TAXON_ID=63592 /ORGANISM="Tetraselmis chuii, Strain PLY429" /LENGTH=192 /DNA_ID=CAMNT_0019277187 /DNA_START=859 /DNA_END=1439 /DNA_ORIENTATION=-
MSHVVGGWVAGIGAAVHTIALCLGLGLFVLASLVLVALLSFFLVPDFLVFEVLVRPRGRSVGVASVAPAGRRLLKSLSGLSFCGRVETNFEAFVFKCREEAVDAVGAAVGSLCVEESGVDEAFGDSLLSGKGLLAFESSNVGSRDSTACVAVLCVRTAASVISQACARSASVAVVERIVARAVSSAASAAAE